MSCNGCSKPKSNPVQKKKTDTQVLNTPKEKRRQRIGLFRYNKQQK